VKFITKFNWEKFQRIVFFKVGTKKIKPTIV